MERQYVWVLVIDNDGQDDVYVCETLEKAKECSRNEMVARAQLAYDLEEFDQECLDICLKEIEEKFEKAKQWDGSDGEGTLHCAVYGDCHFFTRQLVIK